ncbi:hypothetical protein [Pseudobacillus wudalianchiensis]|uniref:hypothetical protein n=1 Tax=Pseudobacillus wudalianchiensis TaxID=1743143 RepID=UPI001146FB13|nr:hypothetical protein [Bacillus wudalianchiensis]
MESHRCGKPHSIHCKNIIVLVSVFMVDIRRPTRGAGLPPVVSEASLSNFSIITSRDKQDR